MAYQWLPEVPREIMLLIVKHAIDIWHKENGDTWPVARLHSELHPHGPNYPHLVYDMSLPGISGVCSYIREEFFTLFLSTTRTDAHIDVTTVEPELSTKICFSEYTRGNGEVNSNNEETVADEDITDAADEDFDSDDDIFNPYDEPITYVVVPSNVLLYLRRPASKFPGPRINNSVLFHFTFATGIAKFNGKEDHRPLDIAGQVVESFIKTNAGISHRTSRFP